MVQSVRPSVCLSVCLSVTPFSLCSHHRIIVKFSNDRTDVHAKSQGQRSKVKVTEVKTLFSGFWTVTSDRIHIWWWNDGQSLIIHRRGALLFFKIIHQISRSHGSNNRQFWPKLGVSGTITLVSIHQWLWNEAQNLKQDRKGALLFLATTKQLYEWYFLSVCPSVRLSVRLSVCPSVTPFWLCSHHRIIMKFSGVITLDQGKVHAKGQGQRSKVKVTEVTTQIFVSGL